MNIIRNIITRIDCGSMGELVVVWNMEYHHDVPEELHPDAPVTMYEYRLVGRIINIVLEMFNEESVELRNVPREVLDGIEILVLDNVRHTSIEELKNK